MTFRQGPTFILSRNKRREEHGEWHHERLARLRRREAPPLVQLVPRHLISPFDGIGVQSVQEPRIDREGKFLRKQRVQLRQIMNLWEVDALKDEERFEVFLTTLLSVETDRISGNIVRSQVILNVQQIMLCFAHP